MMVIVNLNEIVGGKVCFGKQKGVQIAVEYNHNLIKYNLQLEEQDFQFF
jgi:hypothetical protein